MLEITWKFEKEFSAELSRDYDYNNNNIFEKEELQAIEGAIIEYIEPLNFLTTIKHNPKQSAQNLEDIAPLKIEDISYQTYFVNDLLRFSYQIPLSYSLEKGDVFYLNIHDSEGFFVFAMDEKTLEFSHKSLAAVTNVRTDSLFIEFQNSAEVISNERQKPAPTDRGVDEELDGGILQQLQLWITRVQQHLQQLLESIKKQNSITAFWSVMAFSLLYGALHAAGPGHGKSVVASYIFSTNKDVKKALIISLLIGLVHAFAAFILTLLIYFLVTGFLLPFVDRVGYVVTKISAVVIIAIALTLLYNKIKIYLQNKNRPRFSPHKPSCGCSACKVDSKTTDLGVILSAGLVPCPGTVVVFIITISQGMFFVGLMSAVMMSLGMSAVIFATALLSLSIKTKFTQNQKLLQIFEYGAIGIILVVGSLMLLV